LKVRGPNELFAPRTPKVTPRYWHWTTSVNAYLGHLLICHRTAAQPTRNVPGTLATVDQKRTPRSQRPLQNAKPARRPSPRDLATASELTPAGSAWPPPDHLTVVLWARSLEGKKTPWPLGQQFTHLLSEGSACCLQMPRHGKSQFIGMHGLRFDLDGLRTGVEHDRSTAGKRS
jgi:hypothetical protein